MKYVMRVLHKIFPNTYKFCASQHSVNYSLFAHSTLTVRFGQTSLKDRRIIPLNICEFRENWRSEGYNFLMAVNETPLTVAPRNSTIFWEQIVLAGSPHRTAPHRTAPHRTAPQGTAPHHLQYCYLEIKSGTWVQYDIIFQQTNGSKKRVGAWWATVQRCW